MSEPNKFETINITRMQFGFRTGKAFLHGMAVGGLVSTTTFWLVYDQYRPMVFAACGAALLEAVIHFIKAVDP